MHEIVCPETHVDMTYPRHIMAPTSIDCETWSVAAADLSLQETYRGQEFGDSFDCEPLKSTEVSLQYDEYCLDAFAADTEWITAPDVHLSLPEWTFVPIPALASDVYGYPLYGALQWGLSSSSDELFRGQGSYAPSQYGNDYMSEGWMGPVFQT